MKSLNSRQNINIIKDKLQFSILTRPPVKNPRYYYISIENDPQFLYSPYFEDFGPPSILQLYLFYQKIEELMDSHPKKIIIFYSSPTPQLLANAALYISFFRLIYFGYSAKVSFQPLQFLTPLLIPFRDTSNDVSLFELSILDCLQGIEKAIKYHWFDIDFFNPQEWSDNQQIENGGMNWLIPLKLLAFASPYTEGDIVQNPNYPLPTPEKLIPLFQKLQITHIIRLNKQFYDSKIFKDAGFKHTELYFEDGTVPPPHILYQFLSIMDTDDVVALHCKAGLGRTGTLSAAYMIKEGFTAAEAIAWVRLCRPGSIVGRQQIFLLQFQGTIQVGPSFSHSLSYRFSSVSTTNSTQFNILLANSLPKTPVSQRSPRHSTRDFQYDTDRPKTSRSGRSLQSSRSARSARSLNCVNNNNTGKLSTPTTLNENDNDKNDKNVNEQQIKKYSSFDSDFIENFSRAQDEERKRNMKKASSFQVCPGKGLPVPLGSDCYCNNPKLVTPNTPRRPKDRNLETKSTFELKVRGKKQFQEQKKERTTPRLVKTPSSQMRKSYFSRTYNNV